MKSEEGRGGAENGGWFSSFLLERNDVFFGKSGSGRALREEASVGGGEVIWRIIGNNCKNLKGIVKSHQKGKVWVRNGGKNAFVE